MSKKHNNRNTNLEQKQLVRKQQKEIEQLSQANIKLHEHIKTIYIEDHRRFIRVLGCVYDHYADDLLTVEQAGNLLLSLIGLWQGV